jgi:L,D-transpeptidase ErfK/SrfK
MRCAIVFAAAFLIALSALAPARGQQELEQALSRVGVIFGQPQSYQRKGKESIYAIARRFGVSASAIHNANEGDLAAGDEALLIPTERVAPQASAEGVVLNLAERNLYLYRAGQPIRCFPVAIGMRGWETPTGEFAIISKRKNPTWFPPKWAREEEPVPPGPKNPLGDRWMGLSAPGYGMHATNAPATIGRYVSHGCLRMYPEHAHELYELVKVGTSVKITYQPAVLGYRPAEGIVYLAHYPDPYDLGQPTVEEVRALLAEFGLDTVMDEEAVAKALEKPRGIPTPAVGSHIQVRINGRPLRLALAPVPRGGDWLIPVAPLAQAMGAYLEVGPEAGYLSLQRSGQRIFLSPASEEAVVNGEAVSLEAAPQLAAGYPLVPVRAVALALGASVGWDEETQAVLIADGLANPTPTPVLPVSVSQLRVRYARQEQPRRGPK